MLLFENCVLVAVVSERVFAQMENVIYKISCVEAKTGLMSTSSNCGMFDFGDFFKKIIYV